MFIRFWCVGKIGWMGYFVVWRWWRILDFFFGVVGNDCFEGFVGYFFDVVFVFCDFCLKFGYFVDLLVCGRY